MRHALALFLPLLMVGCGPTQPAETLCKDGGFSVSMPGIPRTTSEEKEDFEGKLYTQHEVFSRVDRTSYSASSDRYLLKGEKDYDQKIEAIVKRQRENVEEYLDRVEDDIRRDGKVFLKKATVTVQGHKGRGFEYKVGESSISRRWVFFANGFFFQVNAIGPAECVHSSDTDRFFESFRFLD